MPINKNIVSVPKVENPLRREVLLKYFLSADGSFYMKCKNKMAVPKINFFCSRRSLACDILIKTQPEELRLQEKVLLGQPLCYI